MDADTDTLPSFQFRHFVSYVDIYGPKETVRRIFRDANMGFKKNIKLVSVYMAVKLYLR